MRAKLYDISLLVLSIVTVTPLLMLAFFVLIIGYPLHLIKKIIFP